MFLVSGSVPRVTNLSESEDRAQLRTILKLRRFLTRFYTFTTADVKCLCGGCRQSPRISFLVLLYFLVLRDHEFQYL